MREIVKAAENLGVIVGVEGVHNHTLYSPEMMKRFLDDIDSSNVEVILDGVNFMSEENYMNQNEVIDKAFELFGDKITMIHVKDFIMTERGPETAGIGEGLFCYETLLRHLKADKPYITMLLEESNTGRCYRDIEFLQRIYDSI